MLRTFIVLSILALIVACNTTKNVDYSSDLAAVKKVLIDQQTAWNKGDIEEFMEGYWNSDSLTWMEAHTSQL
jgi:hypothetical protein